jgi:hypothetical protein
MRLNPKLIKINEMLAGLSFEVNGIKISFNKQEIKLIRAEIFLGSYCVETLQKIIPERFIKNCIQFDVVPEEWKKICLKRPQLFWNNIRLN